jgi:hypothetical protein
MNPRTGHAGDKKPQLYYTIQTVIEVFIVSMVLCSPVALGVKLWT